MDTTIVIAHPPGCNAHRAWAVFAARLRRAFACPQTKADGYAAEFWPHLAALGGEDAIIAAGRAGKLGRLQDRVAALSADRAKRLESSTAATQPWTPVEVYRGR